MNEGKALEKIRSVVDACSDCDCCRPVMDTSCLFFPELYRLIDREVETGSRISSSRLRGLTDLCNYCALCPCPNIRADIMEAKSLFIESEGLKPAVRILEDVRLTGRLCGTAPGIAGRLLKKNVFSSLLKKVVGIHQSRSLPEIPIKNFDKTAGELMLGRKPEVKGGKKFAYFAGCSGRYFFPGVPEAVAGLMKRAGTALYFPDQKCCGMPFMLEGDRKRAVSSATENIDILSELVDEGFDILLSCPTCSYMFRNVIPEGAHFSGEYQESVGADSKYLKVPQNREEKTGDGFLYLDKKIYSRILKDSGYFSDLDPLKRLKVADNCYDAGEYLLSSGFHEREPAAGEFRSRILYYPPCHQREQKKGTPYPELLKKIPGADVDTFRNILYCCGMSGITGYKKSLYPLSVELGKRLVEKIDEYEPDIIATDCLSCRTQFAHLTRYRVLHPLEILYRAAKRK